MQNSPFEGAILLPMPGGVLVAVPDSLRHLTTYVLQEQGDYFEDEIKFLRKMISKGEIVVDIGANYGTYSLALGDRVGPNGHIYAFEPAPFTAQFFKSGVAANHFENVTLFELALSDHVGETFFAIEEEAELNRIVETAEDSQRTIRVGLSTLDDLDREAGFGNVAFLKLDAEGEEGNILRGGVNFFSQKSPIVMFEIAHGEQINDHLLEQFASIGYEPYRLLPGLDLLVPLTEEERQKPYLLNVFCIKPDRAETLESAGWLARTAELPVIETESWQQFLDQFEYALCLEDRWIKNMEKQSEMAKLAQTTIGAFAFAHDRIQKPQLRAGAIKLALELALEGYKSAPTETRASTLARIAIDAGERGTAVECARALVQKLSNHSRVQIKEPFLILEQRYADMDPTNRVEKWLLAASAEFFLRTHLFSAFFQPQQSTTILQHVKALGFANDDLERKLQLASRRQTLS